MAITGGGGGREKYNKEYKGMKKEKKVAGDVRAESGSERVG